MKKKSALTPALSHRMGEGGAVNGPLPSEDEGAVNGPLPSEDEGAVNRTLPSEGGGAVNGPVRSEGEGAATASAASLRVGAATHSAPTGCARVVADGDLTNRERFLRACRCEAVDRPPIWLMRQAGRVLPEYRALKEKYSFAELIQTPELATKVTLQPIRRFGFDAAILFSDILVIPEAMGQTFQFREKGGVQMQFEVGSAEAVDRLNPSGVVERLQYVDKAIRLIKADLGSKTALIGFAGAPWTLANFMMEGGSAEEYAKARRLFYTDRSLFDRLCEKLTKATTEYLQMQIEAGVDAVQIFDSLAGLLPGTAFERAAGQWLRQIVTALKGQVPVIVFPKGAHGDPETLASLGAQVVGTDWTARLDVLGRQLPESIGLQGNLDPLVLETTPEAVAAEAERILGQMRGRKGHIFNLGHGVPPTAELGCIERLVTTVRNSHEHA